jgi:hypothetical protein
MNNKIKELADQAGLYVNIKDEKWPKWLGAEASEVAYNKFAKLLIEECAKKVDNVYKQGGGTYGELIRKEFGLYDKN